MTATSLQRFEQLEDRTTPAAIVGLPNPTQALHLVGASGNDVFTLKRVNGAMQVERAGHAASFVNPTTSLWIDGGGGADVLIVDYSDGDPMPAGGVDFDGGVAGFDSLIVRGSASQDVVYLPSATTFGSGTIDIAGREIRFVGLEPVTVSDVASLTFVSPASKDVVHVDRPTPNVNRISGTSGGVAFESLAFFNVPTVTVDLGTNDAGQLLDPGDPAVNVDPLIDSRDAVTIASEGLVAKGLLNFTLRTGRGDDTVTELGTNYGLPAAGGARIWDAGLERDTFQGQGNVDFDLADGGITCVAATIGFIGVESANLVGGSGANVFTLSGWSGTAQIGGAGGNDELIGPDVAANWNVQSSNAGNIGGRIFFNSIENLLGGILNDGFLFAAGASISGRVDGGAGADVIVGPNGNEIWNIDSANAGQVKGIIGAFQRVENLTGGSGADTFSISAGGSLTGQIDGGAGADAIVGPNIEQRWHIVGANAGDISETLGAFVRVENLKGGSASDRFIFSDQASVDGVIDGRSGANSLDYSAYSTAIHANLGLSVGALTGILAGDQEVPARNTVASGTVDITGYDAVARTFTIHLVVQNLSPLDVNGLHIHRALFGVNGPVVIDLLALAPLVPVGAGFTLDATNVPLPAADEAAFIGGITYVNIHTADAPTGLIRGQIFATNNVGLAVGTATGAAAISNIQQVVGGLGDDGLIGGIPINTLDGNAGKDTIVGGPGNDIFIGGLDADVMVWSNGDGTDLMDGGDGADVVQVNGALSGPATNDQFRMSPGAGGRLLFERLVAGAFSLNIGTVETLTVNGIAGDETMTVLNLDATSSLTTVNLNGVAGNDRFVLAVQSNVAINVRGHSPAAPSSPGDQLEVDLADLGAAFELGNFGEAFVLPTGKQPINYRDLETLQFKNVGAATVNGTAGDDALTLSGVAVVPEFKNRYILNGLPAIELVKPTSFTFNGAAGDDRFFVRYDSGDPVPLGGIEYFGGSQTTALGDRLSVVGTATFDALYTPNAALGVNDRNGGFVTVTPAGSGGPIHTIAFRQLEPLDLSGFATAKVQLPGAADQLVVQNGFDAGSGIIPALVVSGTTFFGGVAVPIEAVSLFGNTTVVIDTVTGGVDGADSIVVLSASVGGNVNFRLLTGNGNDSTTIAGATTFAGYIDVRSTTILINAAVTSTGGNINLWGFDDGSALVDNVTVNAPIATTGVADQTVDLFAFNNLLLNASVSTAGSGDVRLVAGQGNLSGALTMAAGAVVSSAAGDVALVARHGAVTVGSIVAGGGVSIVAGDLGVAGSIADANGAALNVTANQLVLLARTGASLDSNVAQLAGTILGVGTLDLAETDDLEITAVAVATSTIDSFAGANILTSLADAGLHSNAGSNIVVTAGGNISINRQVAATGGGGNINLLGDADVSIVDAGVVDDISVGGAGAIVIDAARSISIGAAVRIATVNGNLSIIANRRAAPQPGLFTAIAATDATIASTQGDILLDGRGGAVGISLVGTTVQSLGVGPSAGDIALRGDAADGVSGTAFGIFLGIGTLIATQDGDVVAAVGGGTLAATANYFAISINGGQITSTGSGVEAGNLQLTSLARAGGVQSYGLLMQSAASKISTIDGDISIDAAAGAATLSSVGAAFQSGAIVSSTGIGAAAGRITVVGTASTAPVLSDGVEIAAGGMRISSVDGAVDITGVESTGGRTGITVIGAVGNAPVQTTGVASVTFTANSMLLDTAGTTIDVGTATGKSVILRTRTAGVPIDLGGIDVPNGRLGLTDAELDQIIANVLVIGRREPLGLGTGDITFVGQVSLAAPPNAVPNLDLLTDARVLDGFVGLDLHVANLSVISSTGIGVGDPIEVDVDRLLTTVAGIGNTDIVEANSAVLQSIVANAGNVKLVSTGGAADKLTVVAINAPGHEVDLQIALGSIVDDGANGSRIAAATLRLLAARGIGESPANMELDTAVDAITAQLTGAGLTGTLPGVWLADLDALTLAIVTTTEGVVHVEAATNLAVTNVSSGGDVWLKASGGNLNIGSVSAAGKVVALFSAANIVDGDAANDVTSASLRMNASGAIGSSADKLDTTTTTLAAVSGGGIFVHNVGPLTLGLVSIFDGVPAFKDTLNIVSAGGDVEIDAESPLIAACNVNALGNIALTAGEKNDPPPGGNWADDLSLNLGIAIVSTGGSIVLRAGDDIVLPTGFVLTVPANKSVTLSPKFNDSDQHGSLFLDGDGAAETFLFVRMGGILRLKIDARAPLNLDDAPEVVIQGLAGNDKLIVDYIGGTALPDDGVQFFGGNPVAPGVGDLVIVRGTGTQDVVYTPNVAVAAALRNAGTIDIGDGAVRTINFYQLEPIDVTGMRRVTLRLPGISDVVSVSADRDFGGGKHPALLLAGASDGIAFESIAAWNNAEVVIDTSEGAGVDRVTVGFTANGHGNGTLIVVTGDEAGDAVTYEKTPSSDATTATEAIDGQQGHSPERGSTAGYSANAPRGRYRQRSSEATLATDFARRRIARPVHDKDWAAALDQALASFD